MDTGGSYMDSAIMKEDGLILRFAYWYVIFSQLVREPRQAAEVHCCAL